MTGNVSINADLNFVEKLIGSGSVDLKTCYQCSTCTVVCPLTPSDLPFPRKEMLAAQWGLKDRLVKNMDLWLCHNCSDCTDQCPRGAKPSDVMSALRNQTIEHYSFPSFISKAAKTFKGNLFLFLIPMFIIGLAIYMLNVGNDFAFMDSKPIVYANMMPVVAIDVIFLSAVAFAIFNTLMAMKHFISGLKEQFPRRSDGESLFNAIKGTIITAFSHDEFKKCGTKKSRNVSHLLMMYGFLGLFITTNLVFLIHTLQEFGFDVQDTPLPFFHPVKILGNISAVAAFFGISAIVLDRMKNSKVNILSFFDWAFIGNMFLTIATGILCQIFRVADNPFMSFLSYYIHLVMVFYMLAYAPQTKFGHIFYRPVAMVYARFSGRNHEIEAMAETVENT